MNNIDFDIILSKLRTMLAEDVELYDLLMKNASSNFLFDNAEHFKIKKICAQEYLDVIEKELKYEN